MSTNVTSTVCCPVKTLTDLLNVSPSCLTKRLKCSELLPRHASPRQKVLVCHDMQGGYLQDKYTQGCQTNETCYRFFRWHLIDIFIYFSHELVTIPPLVWIDCAHKNGVQILGTFITEFAAGKDICRQLLASDESVDRAVDSLALLMSWHSFDGYLLNIENPIESEYVERLLSFVSKLKSACAKIDPNSSVIWYDSVTIHGDLNWQNQLNDLNRPFFNITDGIFLNYTWKSEMLLQSKINAGERARDVFVGIDVFGRGCFGGGGFNTCEAMAVSYSAGLSTAIFAPGWLFETLDRNQFLENDRKFWNSLEPYTSPRVIQLKSLTTFFSDGSGDSFFVHGLNIASNPWYNLSLQSYFPNTSSENKWVVDHHDAYFGGSSIQLEGNAQGHSRLFQCLIPIDSLCDVTLVFKDIDDVTLELRFDNGTVILSDKYQEDIIVRQWKRKTYRVAVHERTSLTEISLRYTENTHPMIRLGYLSVRPVESPRLQNEILSPLIQSVEQNSDSSLTLTFVETIREQAPSVILVFTRNQFEEYSFLGATSQSYFIAFRSEKSSDKQPCSMLVIRHYSLDSLYLINEQILSVPLAIECLQGFCSK